MSIICFTVLLEYYTIIQYFKFKLRLSFLFPAFASHYIQYRQHRYCFVQ